MRARYLGDSYDIVKQVLLGRLRHFGPWQTHPMFSEVVSGDDVAALEKLLGTPVVSREVLTCTTNREAYFAAAEETGHLFLDPNTGLRMKTTRGRRAPEYLFVSELLRLAEARPKALTLIFDQSVGRGSERAHVQQKVGALRKQELYATAYLSHACFLLASRDRALVEEARRHLLRELRLPERRFLDVPQ